MTDLDQVLDRIKQLPELIERAGDDYALKKSEYEFFDKKKDATLSAIVSELSTQYPDHKENRLERMALSQQVWVDFLEERKKARYEELKSSGKRDRLKLELEALRTIISHETAKLRLL